MTFTAKDQDALREILLKELVPHEVITALEIMIKQCADKSVDMALYTDSFTLAYSLQGIKGIKTQVYYLLGCAYSWCTDGALSCKRTLIHWVK